MGLKFGAKILKMKGRCRINGKSEPSFLVSDQKIYINLMQTLKQRKMTALNHIIHIFLICLSISLTCQLSAQWIEFDNQTTTWLSTGGDNQEKDVATGDFNRDGWMDIIVARKEPFSNPGARADLLLMNTGTSLVDQTAQYAPDFLSNPSDVRDLFVGDLDNDDWPDVVMANTFEDQPIFYHNLGEDEDGNWLGFADESESRFPLPLAIFPVQFCALWAGDITGNGALDIYFSNYDPAGNSLDVLLINDGNGFFTDESDTRLGALRNSAFGTSVEIHDMDNDGDQDIVKISTLFDVAPWNDIGVFLLFNDGTGNFENWQKIPSLDPYMFTVEDLDQNGTLDVFIVDDFIDYVCYAGEITPDVAIEYFSQEVSDPRSQAFGGNCKFGDLNNDGFPDLGLADVDVDIPPCETGNSLRKFTIMHNSEGALTAPYGTNNYPFNQSTYDFVWVDLDNDCNLDLFMGRCFGYEVFINTGNENVNAVAVTGNTLLCEGASTVLEASPGFVAYTWNDAISGQMLTVDAPGTYCVVAQDSMGCITESCVEVMITTPPTTILTDTLPIQFCTGDTVLLEAVEGFFAYAWSTGTTETSIQVVDGGPYCVTVVDEIGCEFEECILVEEVSNTEEDMLAVLCPGEVVEIGDMVFEATGFYEISFPGGNMFGCDSTLFLEIVAVSPLVVADALINPDDGSASGSIAIQIGGGVLPYEYLWDNGATTSELTGLTPGTYTLTVTDGLGCQNTFEFEVELLSSIDGLTQLQAAIQLFPNPFLEAITVSTPPTLKGEKEIWIYNVSGQVVYQNRFLGNLLTIEEIDQPGMYTYRIIVDQQTLTTGKILKQ